MVIKGLLRPGDHCLVSSMEHNAVMRPLVQLEREGVVFERIPCDAQGRLRLEALPGMIKLNTRLVVMAHGSNVCGTVQDAEAVGKICRERGVPFALDAAPVSYTHLPPRRCLPGVFTLLRRIPWHGSVYDPRPCAPMLSAQYDSPGGEGPAHNLSLIHI